MSRAVAVAVAVAVGLGLAIGSLGCNWIGSRDAKDEAPVADAGAAPDTVEGFLAVLAPLPEGAPAIEIRYQVTGPALEGEMRVALAPGGSRRDHWELRSAVGDTFLRASGTAVVTPDKIWTAPTGEPGELAPNHLAGLAKAYLARDIPTRAKIIASIETWHQTLAEQRERNGGERAELAGVSCLRTRIAAQNVCMWEETGVMLEYEGSAFHLEAIEINREPELAPDTFELPSLSAAAKVLPGETHDYDAVLDELAEGSYAKVSVLLYAPALPALELPKPADESAKP